MIVQGYTAWSHRTGIQSPIISHDTNPTFRKITLANDELEIEKTGLLMEPK